MTNHAIEVQQGERFGFGANWARFLSVLNDERIEEAKSSLKRMLNVELLEGKTFLDVGSGSGLFSLAARLLGAKVHSFDYDPQSVACTAELKRRYFPDDDWVVESGSVLDKDYLSRLGQFDVVYSWGVLHHTGKMWEALGNVAPLVKHEGQLFIAIYNKQQFISVYWAFVKKLYNRSWPIVQRFFNYGYFLFFAAGLFAADILRGRNPISRYEGMNNRGMSVYFDVVDWIGGWPFEVATPEEIFHFFRQRGFVLIELVTCGGKHGCNEFVFKANVRPALCTSSQEMRRDFPSALASWVTVRDAASGLRLRKASATLRLKNASMDYAALGAAPSVFSPRRIASSVAHRVRILLLCRSLDFGGTERQLVNLAKGLHQQGHEVAVMVFYANGVLEKELHESGIPVFDLHKSGRWDVLPFFVRAVRMVRKLKPGVIYGFLGTPNILAAFLKPVAPRTRVVWGVRASNVDLDRYDWLSRLSYRIECQLSRVADVIICNSRAGLEYAAAHGFPRGRMTVIPNGIDIERFKPDAAARDRIRAEWGVAENEILIGLVARLDPMKDHSTFFRAAAMLAQESLDVRFVCVGDGSGPYKDELYHLVSELGLDGRLIWAGARHDMSAVYNALDITASSSYTEGFPNTIAEAMACGVPCVVTDVGDSAIIVGGSGGVVSPASPEALCEGFRLMLKRLGPDLRDAARGLIVNRFTTTALVANTLEALCRLKIILLVRSLDFGGTERQLVNLAKGLHQQGHEVAVMVFYANGVLEKELHESGIPVFDLHKSGRWDVLPFFVRAVRMVRKLKPGVIYGFLGTPNILAAFLKPVAPRTRVVWGVRASNVDLDRYDWLSRLSYRIECQLSRVADVIICNSRAGLEYAAAHGFPRGRMTVIPNGIDIERFKPDAAARDRIRAEWGVAENEILIGLVARLDPMKDHSTFFRAAAMLAQESLDVRFVCVGDGSGPYKDELYHLVSELGLDGRLIWAGARHDMSAVYNALDITASSSYTEGFPNTIAEAMACGVPCVVTDVGDSAIIVGGSGGVVSPASPEALCEGFRLMLKRLGPDLRDAARGLIVNRFTNNTMVTDTAGVLCRMSQRRL